MSCLAGWHFLEVNALRSCKAESDDDWRECHHDVTRYPWHTSEAFFDRFDALKKHLFGSKSVFGLVVDHAYNVEFQNRGYPHIHYLLWCMPWSAAAQYFTRELPVKNLREAYKHRFPHLSDAALSQKVPFALCEKMFFRLLLFLTSGGTL